MNGLWPEDGLGDGSMGELFDEALNPKERVWALIVPATIEDQGPEAVEAWVKENHPGYPVFILPERRSIEDWFRKVREWQSLSPEARLRHQETWMRAFHRESRPHLCRRSG